MTRTTEQLKRRIAEIQQLARELKWQGASGVESAQLALEDAESVSELLAVREAQGVCAGKFVLEPLDQRYHHIKHGEYQYTEPKLPMIKLFTAPPAPDDYKLAPVELTAHTTHCMFCGKRVAPPAQGDMVDSWKMIKPDLIRTGFGEG